jgi:hypothetical protein
MLRETAFKGIDDMDWAGLGLAQTFYGHTIPQLFRELLGEVEMKRWRSGDCWTIDDLMYTFFSENPLPAATPYVCNYLLEALEYSEIVSRPDLVQHFFGAYLRRDYYNDDKISNEVKAKIQNGLPIFLKLLSDFNVRLIIETCDFLVYNPFPEWKPQAFFAIYHMCLEREHVSILAKGYLALASLSTFFEDFDLVKPQLHMLERIWRDPQTDPVLRYFAAMSFISMSEQYTDEEAVVVLGRCYGNAKRAFIANQCDVSPKSYPLCRSPENAKRRIAVFRNHADALVRWEAYYDYLKRIKSLKDDFWYPDRMDHYYHLLGCLKFGRSALYDTYLPLRMYALEAYGSLAWGTRAYVKIYWEKLQDPELEVRVLAAEALAQALEGAVVPHLLELLEVCTQMASAEHEQKIWNALEYLYGIPLARGQDLSLLDPQLLDPQVLRERWRKRRDQGKKPEMWEWDDLPF